MCCLVRLMGRDRPLVLLSTEVLWTASRPFARRRVLLVFTGMSEANGLTTRGIVANLIGVTPEKAIKLAVNDFVREATMDENGNVAWYNGILAGACRISSVSNYTSSCWFLPVHRHQPHGDHQDQNAGPGYSSCGAAHWSVGW